MSLSRSSVLFFAPSWAAHGSAAGVRTERLVRAFREWGCRVSFASASAHDADAAHLESLGVSTFSLPLNRPDELRALLANVKPQVCVFDRYYTEEAHSFGVRALRPGALRILDMQDCHSLRLCRQRVIKAGGSVLDAVRARPDASDANLARELASIHRSDLTLACSPVEEEYLRQSCGVQPSKLSLAGFFIDATTVESASTPPSAFEERNGFASLGTFRHPPNVDSGEPYLSLPLP